MSNNFKRKYLHSWLNMETKKVSWLMYHVGHLSFLLVYSKISFMTLIDTLLEYQIIILKDTPLPFNWQMEKEIIIFLAAFLYLDLPFSAKAY